MALDRIFAWEMQCFFLRNVTTHGKTISDENNLRCTMEICTTLSY